MYFHPEATSQHATRNIKLKANNLRYCTKKEEKDTIYDLSTYILFYIDIANCTE